jgi:hydroxyacylglutathione hydrolase
MSRRALTCFKLQNDLELHVIPGFEDNYFYLLENTSLKQCAAIDPGNAEPVLALIEKRQLELTHILITHHHRDHTGGVAILAARHPAATVVCSEWLKIPPTWSALSIERLNTKDTQVLSVLGAPVQALDVRGHTLDHIAFVILENHSSGRVLDVFVGDALFGAGCGGLFEGTYEQMFAALNRLRELPANTRLWCAHEYTLKNLRVAAVLGVNNPQQHKRLSELEQAVAQAAVREHEWMTIPLKIAEEIATNPFLRWDQPSLQKAIDIQGSLETFTHVRKFRDQF